jgi:hypothetical protein
MKNKKAEQDAARQRHRDQLKESRRKGSSLERAPANLAIKPSILIVCEGENTEPSYFRQFRVTSATIKAVGEGYNTISLVKRAMQLRTEAQYDQVWCVFDKDDFSPFEFNKAIEMAQNEGLFVAYSTQAFEYWLILHLDDHQGGGLHRRDYHGKINELLKPFHVAYDGNGSKKVLSDFFEILDGVDAKTKKRRVDLAIERAKRNLSQFQNTTLAAQESSTTVFLLVEELLKYA